MNNLNNVFEELDSLWESETQPVNVEIKQSSTDADTFKFVTPDFDVDFVVAIESPYKVLEMEATAHKSNSDVYTLIQPDIIGYIRHEVAEPLSEEYFTFTASCKCVSDYDIVTEVSDRDEEYPSVEFNKIKFDNAVFDVDLIECPEEFRDDFGLQASLIAIVEAAFNNPTDELKACIDKQLNKLINEDTKKFTDIIAYEAGLI